MSLYKDFKRSNTSGLVSHMPRPAAQRQMHTRTQSICLVVMQHGLQLASSCSACTAYISTRTLLSGCVAAEPRTSLILPCTDPPTHPLTHLPTHTHTHTHHTHTHTHTYTHRHTHTHTQTHTHIICMCSCDAAQLKTSFVLPYRSTTNLSVWL